MKKNTTIKELEKKYGSKKILSQIEEVYKKNYDKLFSIISHKDSPIHRYSAPIQISFLDSTDNDSNSLVHDLMETLRDAVYFFTLSKKERTKAIQNLRAYEIQYLKLIIKRLSLFINDSSNDTQFSYLLGLDNNITKDKNILTKKIENKIINELFY